jgi:hypothetical protein
VLNAYASFFIAKKKSTLVVKGAYFYWVLQKLGSVWWTYVLLVGVGAESMFLMIEKLSSRNRRSYVLLVRTGRDEGQRGLVNTGFRGVGDVA